MNREPREERTRWLSAIAVAAAVTVMLVMTWTWMAPQPSVLPETGGPTGSVAADGNMDMPVTLTGARDIGALRIDIFYDPNLLEAVEVQSGDLARGAILESNLDTPGQVAIVAVTLQGITGDGTLATVTFRALQSEGNAYLMAELSEAFDVSAEHKLEGQVTPGQFAAAEGAFVGPVISFEEGAQ